MTGKFDVGFEFDALRIKMNERRKETTLFGHESISDMIQKFVFVGDDRNIIQTFVGGKTVKAWGCLKRWLKLSFDSEAGRGCSVELRTNGSNFYGIPPLTNTKSLSFQLTGTKHGGVSPCVFTLYVDNSIARLQKRGIGFQLIELFIACLFYAQDLC